MLFQLLRAGTESTMMRRVAVKNHTVVRYPFPPARPLAPVDSLFSFYRRNQPTNERTNQPARASIISSHFEPTKVMATAVEDKRENERNDVLERVTTRFYGSLDTAIVPSKTPLNYHLS